MLTTSPPGAAAIMLGVPHAPSTVEKVAVVAVLSAPPTCARTPVPTLSATSAAVGKGKVGVNVALAPEVAKAPRWQPLIP